MEALEPGQVERSSLKGYPSGAAGLSSVIGGLFVVRHFNALQHRVFNRLIAVQEFISSQTRH